MLALLLFTLRASAQEVPAMQPASQPASQPSTLPAPALPPPATIPAASFPAAAPKPIHKKSPWVWIVGGGIAAAALGLFVLTESGSKTQRIEVKWP